MKTFEAHGYKIEADLHSGGYAVNFIAYEPSCDEAGEWSKFLQGYVKWDGCSNWEFTAQEDCLLHFCDRESLVNVGLLLAACWDAAADMMGEQWIRAAERTFTEKDADSMEVSE